MTATSSAGPDDRKVLEEVSQRLGEDLRTEPDQIQIDVVGGQVTLVGTVDSLEARQRAEALVGGVAGVSYVINNLRVAQPGGTGATG